jgi:hypothetical protein
MSSWTAEELRAAVLDALSEFVDERAREALVHGEVAIAPAVATWEASQGRVQGHRVTLALDARRLGVVRAAPAVVDALHAAFAAAVAGRKGEALLGLELRWARGRARAVPAGRGLGHGYRDGPVGQSAHAEETVREALAAYLEGSGEPELARIVEGAHVWADPALVRFVLEPEQLSELRAHGHAVEILTAAVRDLLAADGTRVTVEA